MTSVLGLANLLNNREWVFWASVENGCNRETYLEVENLQPGSYILLAEVEWENDFVRKLTNSTVRVNCYGPSQIHFHEINGVNRDQIVK